MKDIAHKLCKVQRDLKCPKDQFNAFAKYNYRNAEGILEAVKPLLAQNSLALTISDDISMIGDRIYVRSTARLISVETGEWLEVSAFAREADEKKGQDSAQVTGACSSYSRKYALNGLFCIDDTKDADATNDHGKRDNASEINSELVNKIIASFNAQTTLAELDAKLAKANTTIHGANPVVQAAYQNNKTRLIK
jgi:hypothetical protein